MIKTRIKSTSWYVFIICLLGVSLSFFKTSSNSAYSATVELALRSNVKAALIAENTEAKLSPVPVKKVEISEQKLPAITYRNMEDNKGTVVYVNKKQAIWFPVGTDKYTASKRGELFICTLKSYLRKGGKIEKLQPTKVNNEVVLKDGNFVLITADSATAKKFGLSQYDMAVSWANSLRVSFNKPQMTKDYSHIASKTIYKDIKISKAVKNNQTGLASWYGGTFHGKKSSDGSRFNKYSFTAAHKSLPLGTLVKVTNIRNNKSCVVKITDRGPFVRGRIIDVSKAAAIEIGMISSGVSKVKVEMVGRY